MAAPESQADIIAELVRVAAGCAEAPSLIEIDQMLALMSRLPCAAVDELIRDTLLEMRTLHTAA